jgi:hypothetical protein
MGTATLLPSSIHRRYRHHVCCSQSAEITTEITHSAGVGRCILPYCATVILCEDAQERGIDRDLCRYLCLQKMKHVPDPGWRGTKREWFLTSMLVTAHVMTNPN